MILINIVACLLMVLVKKHHVKGAMQKSKMHKRYLYPQGKNVTGIINKNILNTNYKHNDVPQEKL
ncbi:hypothetical protein [Psychromonas sp. SA13A]|uniref:hypothetical protein n=1 Tax=Psychromonas sp. SA13A TaxID=2686346 RepID=UPI00140BF197|nr:hypothetical protein [Psychromonas sp. SA13A]